MARLVTGRTKIFSEYRSYHGSTLAAGNATGDKHRFADEIGGAHGFVHFFNPHMYQDGYTRGVDDAECTAKALKQLEMQLQFEGPDNIAAILMETIVGSNGVLLPLDGYMEGIRKLCDKYCGRRLAALAIKIQLKKPSELGISDEELHRIASMCLAQLQRLDKVSTDSPSATVQTVQVVKA